ncbi:tetratricopeptide repeat protein, partial [Roseobacter sp. HKCCA0434]|uniref:tetratricopeptide repeat protein n=1 Tax=Roseobacter sp. HKCCA0434 TaxID=3079297 RepID=UPI002905EB7E
WWVPTYLVEEHPELARLDGVLVRWPEDALAMKLVQSLRFMLGDAAGMRASVATAARGIGADHPMHGYLLGCRAFALEETGDYAAAEAAGRAGLELCPDDAWGLHAVAHVHDMTGRMEDGVRWLAGRSKHWAHCNNFAYHVWWHLALFHLDRGACGPVLELYDRKVRPAATDDFRDIANAASLLFRLEVEGIDVGDRWEELGALGAGRTEDGCLVFADLHYLLALNATGRTGEATRLAARIAADAATLDHDQHEVAALAGQPMARGLLAFRAADYATARRDLAHALDWLPRIGGSHAQRDVFWRLAVEAHLRAGDLAGAEALLARRVLERGAEDGYTARRRHLIARRRAELRGTRIAAQ